MTTTTYYAEYQVTSRIVLTKGVRFKAKGGPYYVKPDGTRMSMAAKGPFTFIRYAERGDQRWIEAAAKKGGIAILALTPRESSLGAGYVPRPYRIAGRARGPKAQRSTCSKGIATETTIVYTEGVAQGQRQTPRRRRRGNGKERNEGDSGTKQRPSQAGQGSRQADVGSGEDGLGLPCSGAAVHREPGAAVERKSDGGVQHAARRDGVARPAAAGRLIQRRLFE